MGGSIGNATDRWYPPAAAYSPPMISLRFLGAAGGVTGSQFLLTVGDRRVVVDCGLFQGGMDEIARNRMAFSYAAEDVHAVLLTHAHNDHIGRLPALVRAGYHGPVFATDATADLAEIVLIDSAELQAHAAERWKRRHPEAAAARAPEGESEATASEMEMAATAARMPRPPDLETRTHAPLFDVDDVRRTMELVRPVPYATVDADHRRHRSHVPRRGPHPRLRRSSSCGSATRTARSRPSCSPATSAATTRPSCAIRPR